MRLFGKKSGFSLMEIIIAVLIVAILALAVTPIIGRQMQKSKEYSYYLAYRTLEKMAGQIVMQGEPNSDATSYNQVKPSFFKNMVAKMNYYSKPLKHLANKLEIKWAYTEGKLFSRIFSKTNAEDRIIKLRDVITWDSEDYDYYSICYAICDNSYRSYQIPKGKDRNGNTTYYSSSDCNNCVGYTKNGRFDKSTNKYVEDNNGDIKKYSAFRDSLTSDLLTYNDEQFEYLVSIMRSKNLTSSRGFSSLIIEFDPKAEAFCDYLLSEYNKKSPVLHNNTTYYIITDNTPTYSGLSGYIAPQSEEVDEESDEEWDNIDRSKTPRSTPPGTCTIKAYYYVDRDVYVNSDSNFIPPEYPVAWCDEHGYTNFTNVLAPEAIDCQPKDDSYAVTENDEKVAYIKCPDGQKLYNQCPGGGTCQRLCTSEAFNEYTQQPCGPNATYNGGVACDCNVGWKMDDGKCLEKAPCPVGTKKNSETGLCVANPPLITGKSLCRLIKQHWNIQKDADGAADSCNVFSPNNNNMATAHLYEMVYSAVTKDGKYMSLDANVGAFNNPEMQPNIKLSNGLKLWILGDKAASIPGLSFFNTNSDIKPHQNMCILQSSVDKGNCSSIGQGYYCKNDNNCYRLHGDSTAEGIDNPEVRKNLLLDARGCCSANEFGDLISMVSSDNLKKFYQEPTVYAISGFTVFVDIDGDKGSGTLWDDVFPFYIATDGRVYPGYPLDGNKNAGLSSLYIGGNSEQMLPTDVYYYDNAVAGTQLARKTAFSNVSYARAVCSARIVSKHTPYCMNLGEKFKAKGTDGNPLGSDYISDDNKDTSKNPCDHHKCFVSVRNKLRYF